MKTLLLISQLSLFTIGFSQISENFSDGDFNTNPSWSGTTGDYIVNASLELQTNLTVSATSYLSAAHGLTNLDNKEWRMRVKMTFSPSTSNFGRIYLIANGANPTTNPDGFYLQLGEALAVDAVKLYKQIGGIQTLVCTGTAGQIASAFTIGIRVTRDIAGLWSLFVDPLGGTNYVFEASATDVQNLLGTHFSWQCVYTSSNANKFFLDDIYVGNILIDNVAPALISATPIGPNALDVLFSEPLNQLIAENPSNYDLLPFNSFNTAILDGSNPNLVHLTTIFPMMNGNSYTLFALNMEDLVGNDSLSQSVNFNYIIPEQPLPGDVIINEFFADPTPSVGLPELEFVEIYNRSTKYLNTNKWKVGDASTDGTISATILAPGEYKILCATTSTTFYPGALGVTSFPSLNNAGDNIVLKDSNGIVLDLIVFTDAWYQDAFKMDGGFTIERINPTLPCSWDKNWIASINVNGGTPGAQNSTYSAIPDTQAPYFETIFAEAPNSLKISFSEPMDSLSLVNALLLVQPSLTEISRSIPATQPTEMTFLFSPNIIPSQDYSFTLQNVEDCAGNLINLNSTFILPDSIAAGDLVINEILFDPLVDGSDYVELYNRSSKVLDLFGLEFANISKDSIANREVVSVHFILRPSDFVVLTKDTLNCKLNYPYHGQGQLVENNLPSYNNDSGTVLLLNGVIVLDRVSYTAKWHFELMDNDDGKSLERINAEDPSQLPDNWHTAAETVQFGTPGRENSQFVPQVSSGELSLTSKILSPDNDGFEDVLQIRYKMSENDLLGKITIYDDQGRVVRKLKENEYLATEGLFTWDGVDDHGKKASIGQYVVYFEAFRPNGGAVFKDRKVCVVAGKI